MFGNYTNQGQLEPTAKATAAAVSLIKALNLSKKDNETIYSRKRKIKHFLTTLCPSLAKSVAVSWKEKVGMMVYARRQALFPSNECTSNWQSGVQKIADESSNNNEEYRELFVPAQIIDVVEVVSRSDYNAANPKRSRAEGDQSANSSCSDLLPPWPPPLKALSTRPTRAWIQVEVLGTAEFRWVRDYDIKLATEVLSVHKQRRDLKSKFSVPDSVMSDDTGMHSKLWRDKDDKIIRHTMVVVEAHKPRGLRLVRKAATARILRCRCDCTFDVLYSQSREQETHVPARLIRRAEKNEVPPPMEQHFRLSQGRSHGPTYSTVIPTNSTVNGFGAGKTTSNSVNRHKSSLQTQSIGFTHHKDGAQLSKHGAQYLHTSNGNSIPRAESALKQSLTAITVNSKTSNAVQATNFPVTTPTTIEKKITRVRCSLKSQEFQKLCMASVKWGIGLVVPKSPQRGLVIKGTFPSSLNDQISNDIPSMDPLRTGIIRRSDKLFELFCRVTVPPDLKDNFWCHVLNVEFIVYVHLFDGLGKYTGKEIVYPTKVWVIGPDTDKSRAKFTKYQLSKNSAKEKRSKLHSLNINGDTNSLTNFASVRLIATNEMSYSIGASIAAPSLEENYSLPLPQSVCYSACAIIHFRDRSLNAFTLPKGPYSRTCRYFMWYKQRVKTGNSSVYQPKDAIQSVMVRTGLGTKHFKLHTSLSKDAPIYKTLVLGLPCLCRQAPHCSGLIYHGIVDCAVGTKELPVTQGNGYCVLTPHLYVKNSTRRRPPAIRFSKMDTGSASNLEQNGIHLPAALATKCGVPNCIFPRKSDNFGFCQVRQNNNLR